MNEGTAFFLKKKKNPAEVFTLIYLILKPHLGVVTIFIILMLRTVVVVIFSLLKHFSSDCKAVK